MSYGNITVTIPVPQKKEAANWAESEPESVSACGCQSLAGTRGWSVYESSRSATNHQRQPIQWQQQSMKAKRRETRSADGLKCSSTSRYLSLSRGLKPRDCGSRLRDPCAIWGIDVLRCDAPTANTKAKDVW